MQVFFILLTFFVTPSRAAPRSPIHCHEARLALVQDLGASPNGLHRNPEAMRMVDHEKINYGKLVTSNRELENLPNNFYVYLITDEGKIIFSPRVPNLFAKKNELVSHRSLTNYYSSIFKRKPNVIAAGEFEVAFGECAYFNNKANTYWGNEKQNDIAKSIFKKNGLTIRDGVETKDFSTYKPAKFHLAELEELKLHQKILQSPRISNAIKNYQVSIQSIYKHYPGTPGKIDWLEFMVSDTQHTLKDDQFLSRFVAKVKVNHPNFTPNKIFSEIQLVSIPQEFAYRIDKLTQSVGEENIEELMLHLADLEGKLN